MPQGAPSSPVYFNIDIDELVLEVEKCTGNNDVRSSAVVSVADDVLFQASTKEALQNLLT